MTVKELANTPGFSALCLPCPEKAINGGYAGDLLSWVMAGAGEGNAWVTIMSNVNVIAVASLCDVACVVLAQGVTLDEKELQTACEKGINVLTTPERAFETCVKIGAIVK